MDWECALLYNLCCYVPGWWSLKSSLKMVAIFCMNPASALEQSTNFYNSQLACCC